jgi:hypothetical protein
MAELSLDLRVIDVDGQLVSDPTVFVRVARPDGTGTATKKVSLVGAPAALRFHGGPSGFSVILRITPSRYMDGAVFCTVDGDGVLTPRGPVRLPRRSSEWRPSFIAWQRLSDPFEALQTVLDKSPAFQLGSTSNPERFVEDHYDAIDPDDESRVLAKLSLLNLYSRLRTEIVPTAGAPWFSLVDEMLVATRERFIAQVDEECWERVRAFADDPPLGFNDSPPDLHRRNFEALPGVTEVTDLASVKTREDKANLQFTVCRAVRQGKPVFLLDTDIDENGNLLLHTFDLVKHKFSGGTHPIDIHESLRKAFPQVALGYELEPRVMVGDAIRAVGDIAAAPPVRLGGVADPV